MTQYVYIVLVTKYNIQGWWKKMRNMMIVTEVKTQQELNEMKSVMEIFVVKNRVRELALLA